MVAEAFLTLGLALEIATAFYPKNFVLLAGAGNLSKAAGRGMTNPCFRIIQTHFAVANNIGDVAAKEEVSCAISLLPRPALIAHTIVCRRAILQVLLNHHHNSEGEQGHPCKLTLTTWK